jgi:hypothetical protein
MFTVIRLGQAVSQRAGQVVCHGVERSVAPGWRTIAASARQRPFARDALPNPMSRLRRQLFFLLQQVI